MKNPIRTGAFMLGLLMLAISGTGEAAAPPAANPIVVIETSLGSITAELFADKAPKSVENFLAYVKAGYYSGTIFHRVIRGFMIQGGGLKADFERKQTRPPIPNEATNGLSNLRGTLAMARTPDVNSATSQFFINTVDNAKLDHRGQGPGEFGYAVFGKVIAGMEVVDKIEGVPTTTKMSAGKMAYPNAPLSTLLIKAVRIKK